MLALWAALFGASADAQACAFDGLLGPGLTAQHPRSIAVALAIRAAVDEGLIGPDAVSPIVPGGAGYWRAVSRLRAFELPLIAAAERTGPVISILLVDSSLWARLAPARDGMALEIHTPAARPGDVAIVTSEAILAAVTDGRLTFDAALDRGLIAIDAAPEASTTIRLALTSALAERGAPSATVRPIWLSPSSATRSSQP
jgi:hypothetical protein